MNRADVVRHAVAILDARSAVPIQKFKAERWVNTLMFSDDGRYLACNRAFCDLTGYSREEISRMRVGVDLAVSEQSSGKLFRESCAARASSAPAAGGGRTARRSN
jgi:PAS domain-containing protein